MTDLTPQIEEALSKAGDWTTAHVFDALNVLARVMEDLRIDWEPNDEEWGRLVLNNKAVAFVCAKLPLILTQTILSEAADEYANQTGAIVFVACDFDKRKYSVSRVLLEKIFQHEVSANLDYDQLSINELWWATV